MSIKCMTRVWDHSTVGGSELLVLLAIADHAHDDGTGAWPSLTTIAKKTKISRRNVSRVINSLIEKGELRRDSGGGPYGTNAYVVLSGLAKRTAGGRKCYLCGTPEGSTKLIDEHHPNPDDSELTVTLCRPCHLKIHKLLGKDNLSLPADGMDTTSLVGTPCPHESEKQGQDVPSGRDKMAQVGTPRDETRDTAMSHDPSLTVNLDPSREPSDIWKTILGDLKLQMTEATFNTWLLGSRLKSADNGTWQVEVKHPHAADWLNNRLLPLVMRTVQRREPDVETVEFVST